MRLLVVRHAIAEDREAFARSHKDDADRPLTSEGRRKLERAALGLKVLVPELDVLAASPYKRAFDTAEIIAASYGGLTVERVPELAPGAGLDRVLAWLTARHTRGSVAVVGHEPDLNRLVCTLLSATNGPLPALRNGTALPLCLPGPGGRAPATLGSVLGPQ